LVITTHKSLHTPHPGLNVITSTVRILAGDPLTQYKTANRLPNILARAEADAANADEALISNNRDRIAEASGANIFIARGDKILTPPLCAGALAGTTREFILRIAGESSVTATEEDLTVADLYAADSAFLCSAHWLVAPIISLDGRAMQTKGAATVKALRQACEQAALGR
jgi:branched-subunit amino acid aminotransferase/4-amino-4-deoxychorismate lyase